MGSERKRYTAAFLGAAALVAVAGAGTAWADGTAPPAASGGQTQATAGSGGQAGGTAADSTPAATNARTGGGADGPGGPGAQGAQATPSGNPPGSAPQGSNGTIKVEESNAGPSDAGPDNDPQLTCGAAVVFYGFDAPSDTATLTFTAQAPSTGSGRHTVQGIALSGGRPPGSTKDGSWSDPSLATHLGSGITAVAQGAKAGSYHLKVTAVVTDPANNTTTRKTKVFWLKPCTSGPVGGATLHSAMAQGPTATGTSVQGVSLTRSGGVAPHAVSDTSTGSPAGGHALRPARPGTAVLAESLHRGALPFSLPFTGFSAPGLLAWAAGLAGAGSGAVALSRRRRPQPATVRTSAR